MQTSKEAQWELMFWAWKVQGAEVMPKGSLKSATAGSCNVSLQRDSWLLTCTCVKRVFFLHMKWFLFLHMKCVFFFWGGGHIHVCRWSSWTGYRCHVSRCKRQNKMLKSKTDFGSKGRCVGKLHGGWPSFLYIYLQVCCFASTSPGKVERHKPKCMHFTKVLFFTCVKIWGFCLHMC